MGWTNSHLYLFRAGESDFGEPDEDWPDVEDSASVTLEDVVRMVGPSFEYIYDMGDHWEHELTVTGPLHGVEEGAPRCTGGARACPPEDSGGPWRYQEMLEAIADPAHEEHEDFLDWIGENFDPEAFDLQEVNDAFRSVA
jgi:hypothetical protein